MDFTSFIRTVPDYPKPGIQFRDITTLLKDPIGFAAAIDALVARYRTTPISKIVAIESRGFLFGAPLAVALGLGFVPARKPGKLPGKTTGHDYTLEYGVDRIEMHDDAITAGDNILIVDDLLATGGTAHAAVSLVQKMGGRVVECAFLVDLPDLGGRARLEALGLPVFALCAFPGD
ncbi:MAG: adenine phosphoribosyltransferase [Pseudomonadota bacterium]|jgi:adenine phosphoribosyltransferase